MDDVGAEASWSPSPPSVACHAYAYAYASPSPRHKARTPTARGTRGSGLIFMEQMDLMDRGEEEFQQGKRGRETRR